MSPRRRTISSLVFACIFISIIVDDTVHCQKAQVLQTRWFAFFNLFILILNDYQIQDTFHQRRKKSRSRGDNSRPSNLSWRDVKAYFSFSVTFLHSAAAYYFLVSTTFFVLLSFLIILFFLFPDQWHASVTLPHLQ